MIQPIFEHISIIGLGYIGLPTAAMIASHKVRVTGVDVMPAVVKKINQGQVHIVEPDLDIAVHRAVADGYLTATTTPEPAQAFLIAVPTPLEGHDHEPDLKYIEAAAKAIGPVLEKGNLIILESTSPVGTTEAMASWMAEVRPDLTFPQTHAELSDIRVAHCPERVLPGQVMRELVENDRIIGGMTPACSKMAIDLYKIFVLGNCVITDVRTAEMAKLTENSFRDVNIAFANELSMICDKLDIDVWELIQLANRHPRVNILRPGSGVGGHCIAIDPWFIVSKTPDLACLIEAARTVNDSKPDWVIEKIQATLGAWLMEHPGKTAAETTIACYGLAFKPDIDDLRESPALEIALKLTDIHVGRVLSVEPNIEVLPDHLGTLTLANVVEAKASADIHVFLVAHKIFRDEIAPQRYQVDAVGLWSSHA